MEKKKLQLTVFHLNSASDELTLENEGLNRDLREIKMDEERLNETSLRENAEKAGELESLVEELKERLATKEDQYKSLRSSSEKTNAVQSQKVEFLEEQLNESKRLIETNETERKMDNRQLVELKEVHRK